MSYASAAFTDLITRALTVWTDCRSQDVTRLITTTHWNFENYIAQVQLPFIAWIMRDKVPVDMGGNNITYKSTISLYYIAAYATNIFDTLETKIEALDISLYGYQTANVHILEQAEQFADTYNDLNVYMAYRKLNLISGECRVRAIYGYTI